MRGDLGTSSPLTIISLFAGCGGSLLGYREAGYKELLAVDFDKRCGETINANFPGVDFWDANLREVSPDALLKRCGIGKSELSVLDGSPPCQGFSISGKRRASDKRNTLIGIFGKFVLGIMPKVFVMENVKGLIQGEKKRILWDFTRLLESDYEMAAKVLNAKWYGVPQSRLRVFCVGIRCDLGIRPSFPVKSDKVITAKEAIGGIIADNAEIVLPRGPAGKFAPQIGCGEDGSKLRHSRSYFGLKRISPNRPCPTLLALWSPGCAHLLHWREDRFLIIREMKALCSFPDDFILCGNIEEQVRQLGNSVMPKQMLAIAKHIKEICRFGMDKKAERING
jgi:DNA (cytosine-5)-methyltransferase 1